MIFTLRNRQLKANVKKLTALESNIKRLNEENKILLEIIETKEKSIENIISEKTKGFPWLAEAISEFYQYQDEEIAKYLELKKHPAYKKAEHLREISNENKILRKQLKVAQNIVKYYETLFPWINEYVGQELDELIDSIRIENTQIYNDQTDPVLKFIPTIEYEKLSISERNQKALERYLNSRKTSVEIGRDYERYIGYLYESKGYKVEYVGIEKGLEDLGRDLICFKDEEVEIVQCKCWSNHKTIHEKHINQLYGTVIKYCIDQDDFIGNSNQLLSNNNLMQKKSVKATFITSTKLSESAKKFAAALGIEVVENKPLDKYPLIKCNINSKGEKIYHLPFDQQYDKTLISSKGEFYAATVKEAEEKGFRRAFKWNGVK